MNERKRPQKPPAMPEPCEDGGKYLRLLVPVPYVTADLALVGQHVWGLATHFDPGERRTYPCSLTPDCTGCKDHGQLPHWSGYIHAVLLHNGMHVIATVTADAFLGCGDLNGNQGDLRGRRLTLRRKGEAKRSPVEAAILGRYPESQLPAAREIRPMVCSRMNVPPDWWEWHVGLDPVGVRCPGIAMNQAGSPRGPKEPREPGEEG